MLELFEDRAVFNDNGQRQFLKKIFEKLTTAQVARICNRSERAVRDWCREKFYMPVRAVQLLSTAAGIRSPKVQTLDVHKRAQITGRAGGHALVARYGKVAINEDYRKEQWYSWWKSKGKFQKNPILEPKKVHRPKR